MNQIDFALVVQLVSAGCHINDVMNDLLLGSFFCLVSAGCHINDVMNFGPCQTGR